MGNAEVVSILLAASLMVAACLGVLLRDAGVPMEPAHVLAMAACLAAGVACGALAILHLRNGEEQRPPE